MKSACFKENPLANLKYAAKFFLPTLALGQKIFMSYCIFFLLLSPSFAQKKVVLAQIAKAPQLFSDQTVIVEGSCIQRVDSSMKKSSNAFLFQDSSGIKINVETVQELPKQGEKIAIACVVVVSSNGKISHLEEKRRIWWKFPRQQEISIFSIMFFCLFGIISLVFATMLLFQVRRNKLSAEKVNNLLTRNRTRRVQRPASIVPDTTYKSLPGKLVIQKNKKILQVIDLYQTKAQACFTIGRAAGPPVEHIRIEDDTVSMQQAKIEYTDNKFILTNLSRTNPSIVDGVQLAKNQSVELPHDSTIVMGEIIAKFEKAAGGELWQLK